MYVRFPPKWRNVLVPTEPRSATALGTTLYTASRPVPLLAQRALWLAARTVGSRALPGPRENWRPDLPEAVFAGFRSEWLELTAGRCDGLAVYNRPQSHRSGLVVLVCAGPASIVVRVRDDPRALDHERLISEAADRLGAEGVRVPRLRGRGSANGWHWSAYEAIASRPHRPARVADEALCAKISAVVEAALPAPTGMPPDWRGSHGDLTGWNLRVARRQTWLMDWEDAGWAPPGTDELYFAATTAALHSKPAHPLALAGRYPEAAARLAGEIANRPTEASERQLQERLLIALGPV